MVSDVRISTGDDSAGTGPLAILNSSSFARTTFRYPIDIGSPGKGHYVVFFARMQKDSGYQINELGAIPNAPIVISKKGLPSRTVLTTDAVALYMPDTILFEQEQSYDVLSPGTEFLGQAIAAGKSVNDENDKGAEGSPGNVMKKNLILLGGSQAAQRLNLGAVGQLAFNAITGTVVNPMLEMIYRSPNFRSFQFDFMFYPRTVREAFEVQNILERFRFHQSPELVKGAEGFLIPPSEFEIVFYYNGKQNPNIPAIATCVLTNTSVNMAPNGWSALEIPNVNEPILGGTGMPTAIQLTLQFRETTYLTKDDFRNVSGAATFNMGQ
jgi:hypothetical protein